MTDPRYPIGPFKWNGYASHDERLAAIHTIADTPVRLRLAVDGLSEEQLSTPYREGGWTVRQVVHHLPDSHMNAYCRMKLALTENEPLVKPYEEAMWAELPDSKIVPVETSLQLLDSLHTRWVALMRALAPADYGRIFMHPEYPGGRSLDWLVAIYAWHGPHHIAHITTLRDHKGW